jgi:hypothetical protein
MKLEKRSTFNDVVKTETSIHSSASEAVEESITFLSRMLGDRGLAQARIYTNSRIKGLGPNALKREVELIDATPEDLEVWKNYLTEWLKIVEVVGVCRLTLADGDSRDSEPDSVSVRVIAPTCCVI